MDRNKPSGDQHSAAVRAPRPESVELLSGAGGGIGGEPGLDATDRRAVPADAVYGSRKMAFWLTQQGYAVNRKRAQRLMRTMGLEAIYPRPNTTRGCPEHRIYPYLLRDVAILRPNQVWSTDITYIPLARGYGYLTAG